ncbi:MAG TPA: complex I NDUFA9 subunit family protein [Chromatiaceae bacterium]|jgi:NADH dehydrogenase|nr:complex I NDUFA9 subunit family protein [Chromatiaceae bacterium]HIA09187.1 complex I NDUFA9 subunit family protein [Chromatiaceae bacterium]HIN81550.1 complex I NDUFA9 subunit family protein [Chromatiales bacterium]HIO53561.1 complex I NDUFA9 subunit family protein [Chromatiales bacterium]
MKINSICILGGSGFVGRHLIPALANGQRKIRVLSSHPQRARHLLVSPGVELVKADVFDPASLRNHFTGFDCVINLVGILNESRAKHRGFRAVHVELPTLIAESSSAAGVSRLLHMSALQADSARGTSLYLRTKGEGENRIAVAGSSNLSVSVYKPSVMFGPGDKFLNRFASLLRMSPLMFPLACPNARFAPVYVGDVVEAMLQTLDAADAKGVHYELCGPEQLTLRELVQYTATNIGSTSYIVGLSDRLSRIQARILQWVPGKPFSLDNYLSLQTDSICSKDGFAQLGITPRSLGEIVPGYLGQSGQAARLDRWRARAGRNV